MNAYITTATNHDDDLVGTYVTEEHPHALVQSGYVSTAHSDRAEGEYVSTTDTQPTQYGVPVVATGLVTAVAH